MKFTLDEINLLQYIIKNISDGMGWNENVNGYIPVDIQLGWNKKEHKIFNSLKEKIKNLTN